MNLKTLLKKTDSKTPPRVTRARASNGTTPDATRLRFTPEQRDKLERWSAAKGVSIAQVVRDLIDQVKEFK